MKRPAWVCELCYKEVESGNLPDTWELVWQSAICPACLKIAERRKLSIGEHRGGCYANGKRDPRAKVQS